MMIRSTRNWLQTDQILAGVDGPFKSLIGDHTLSGLDQIRVVVAKRPLGWILLRLTRRSSAAATDEVPASLARVQRQVEADGWTVAAQYRGWPSPTALTILVPTDERPMFGWLQRSGVIGGGRTSTLLRGLFRSSLITAVLWRVAPAQVLVIQRKTPKASS